MRLRKQYVVWERIKRGVDLNAERRMQNAERLHSANAPLTGKELNEERKASTSGVTQSVVLFYYIYHCERSATKRR